VYQQLESMQEQWADHGIKSIKILGDAEAPAPIAWATYAGHRYARELDEPDHGDTVPFRRELVGIPTLST